MNTVDSCGLAIRNLVIDHNSEYVNGGGLLCYIRIILHIEL